MAAVFYIEAKRNGLDHRVFRILESGAIEWAHFKEWLNDWDRARYYGFGSQCLPENCQRIEL